jgi:hypothetical protein
MKDDKLIISNHPQKEYILLYPEKESSRVFWQGLAHPEEAYDSLYILF